MPISTSPGKRKARDESEHTSVPEIINIRGDSVVSNLSVSMHRLSIEPSRVLRSGATVSTRSAERVRHPKRARSDWFVIPPDCLVESGDLLLEGETLEQPERDEDDDDDDDTTLPIRMLDRFVVFDEANDNKMASLSDLEGEDTMLRVYGMIRPKFLSDQEEDISGEGVSNTPDVSEDVGEYQEFVSTVLFVYYLDSNPLEPMVWLKTEYSWLILDRPAAEYRSIYNDFWEPRYLCRLGLMSTRAASRHFELDMDDIPQNETGGALALRGEPFSPDESLSTVQSNEDVVKEFVEDAAEGGWNHAHAAFDELFAKNRSGPSKPRRGARARSYSPSNSPPRQSAHPQPGRKAMHFRPFFTPNVARFASRLGLLLPSQERALKKAGPTQKHLHPDPDEILGRISSSVAKTVRGEMEGAWGLDTVSKASPRAMDPVYHVHDFVYVQGKVMGEPFRIGQIVAFQNSGTGTKVIFQSLGRYDSLNGLLDDGEPMLKDPRHLYTTRKLFIGSLNDLRGQFFLSSYDDFFREGSTLTRQNDQFYAKWHCYTKEREGPLTRDDFVLLPFNRLPQCQKDVCVKRARGTGARPAERLRCLELFHGAGGLGLGLEQAGAITTKWAVDASESTHLTFKANFPKAKVILQDTNAVLRRAVELSEGKDPAPLYQMNDDERLCPELPKPGDVDIIIGGPPCQGFSRLNSFRIATDVRNSLVGNMLSYVDYLQPRFVLIENVGAMLNLQSRAPADREGGRGKDVEHAFAKFVVGFLVQRGYQVRFKVVHAAQYGAPQARNRVIFWAALKGEVLPQWPLPTHTCLARSNTYRDAQQGAPHPVLTVKDAISDLPPFHWDWTERGVRGWDPDLPRPNEPRVRAITQDRNTNICGFPKPVRYGKQPQTAYQQLMRGDCGKVEYHVTKTRAAREVERICNIPPPQPEINRPEGLDWRDMCAALAPWEVAHPHGAIMGDTSSNIDAKYSRVYASRPAQTVVTTIIPRGRMPRVLHYSQYRVLTARENARLQGFPDSFKFVSPKDAIDDIYRLIGNAVPVPLVYQLGLELNKALVKKEEREAARRMEEEGSPEL